MRGLRIGDWVIEPDLYRIRRGDEVVRLRPRSMEVLLLLAERPLEPVTRDDFHRQLWHGAHVTDDVLTQGIAELRRAFADDPKQPRYIETIPRKGYRLIAAVSRPGESPDESPSTLVSQRRRPGLLLGAVALGGLVALITLMVTLQLRSPASPSPEVDSAIEGSPRPTRIVVLPFEFVGPPNDSYLAQGLTEEITSRLVSVRGLEVISRTSSDLYRGREVSIREVAEQLDADYVLEGAVQLSPGPPERVRVSPQLIRAADDSHVWAERYDHGVIDVLETQARIARSVVRQLGLALRDAEGREVTTLPTHDRLAYNAYLRATQLESTDPTLTLALLERAVERDPDFALAHAQRAILLMKQLVEAPSGAQREAGYREVEAALVRSTELAPEAPATRLATAWYSFDRNELANARKELERGLRATPDEPRLLNLLGEVQTTLGELDAGIQTQQRALELDPRNGVLASSVAGTLLMNRRYAEALDLLRVAETELVGDETPYLLTASALLLASGDSDAARAALDRAPRSDSNAARVIRWWVEWCARNYEPALEAVRGGDDLMSVGDVWLFPRPLLEGLALERLGRVAAAQSAFEDAIRIALLSIGSRSDGRLHSALGVAHAALGERQPALENGRRAVELGPYVSDSRYLLAEIHARLGEPTMAVEQLRRSFESPGTSSPDLLRVDPRWDTLQRDAGMQTLLDGR